MPGELDILSHSLVMYFLKQLRYYIKCKQLKTEKFWKLLIMLFFERKEVLIETSFKKNTEWHKRLYTYWLSGSAGWKNI